MGQPVYLNSLTVLPNNMGEIFICVYSEIFRVSYLKVRRIINLILSFEKNIFFRGKVNI